MTAAPRQHRGNAEWSPAGLVYFLGVTRWRRGIMMNTVDEEVKVVKTVVEGAMTGTDIVIKNNDR